MLPCGEPAVAPPTEQASTLLCAPEPILSLPSAPLPRPIGASVLLLRLGAGHLKARTGDGADVHIRQAWFPRGELQWDSFEPLPSTGVVKLGATRVDVDAQLRRPRARSDQT